jgi:hypothetical protein
VKWHERFENFAVGDIVRTPKGALAIVRQVDREHGGTYIAICFPEGSRGEHEAWWGPADGLQLECCWRGLKHFANMRAGKRKAKR